jgi:hypothetical protein
MMSVEMNAPAIFPAASQVPASRGRISMNSMPATVAREPAPARRFGGAVVVG